MKRLDALIAFLAKASGTEMATLAAALPVDWPIPRFRDDYSAAPQVLEWRLIFACWFELDAEAAQAFSFGRDDALLKRIAIEAWAATDPDSAMAAVANDDAFNIALRIMTPLRPLNLGYGLWRDDPERFWAMITTPRARSLWTNTVIEVPEQALLDLALSDPESAAQRALRFRPDALEKVLDHWATTDPETMMRWAHADQAMLTNGSFSIGNAADRRILALQALAKITPSQAVAWLEARAESAASGLPEIATLAATWAGQDAVAARSWANTLTDPQQHKDALVAIASATASSDPHGAAALLASIDWDVMESPRVSGGMQPIWRGGEYLTCIGVDLITDGQSVASTVLGQLARHDPATAMAYVAEISDRTLQSDARDSVWQTVIEENTAMAITMATTSANQGETKPLQNLVRKLAKDDPSNAFELAQKLAADLPAEAAEAVLHSTMRAVADPELAVALISELNPQTQGLIPPAAFGHLVREWSEADLAGATAWVSTLPPGIDRDYSISSLVSTAQTLDTHSDFSSVLELADMIENPARRRNIATELMQQWLNENPTSRIDAVEQETLPEDFRTALDTIAKTAP
ncbi:MAG: hypothetical protein R3F19_34955 [Verrucomicrobiales bacterium]